MGRGEEGEGKGEGGIGGGEAEGVMGSGRGGRGEGSGARGSCQANIRVFFPGLLSSPTEQLLGPVL